MSHFYPPEGAGMHTPCVFQTYLHFILFIFLSDDRDVRSLWGVGDAAENHQRRVLGVQPGA
jgi:hypothetical protein